MSVEALEASVSGAVAAASAPLALGGCLRNVFAVLRSRDAAGRSFLLAASGGVCDYVGVYGAFERLLSREANPWAGEAAEELRTTASFIFERDAPLPVLTTSSEEEEVAEAAPEEDEAEGAASAVAAMPPMGDDGAVEASGVDGTAEVENGPSVAWPLPILAAILPLLANALPRDANGVCIIPHPHNMEKQEAGEGMLYLGGSHRPVFRTNKICDNCGERIIDPFFYHCAEDCDIDFCEECHQRSQDLLDTFIERRGGRDKESVFRQLFWVIDVLERTAAHVLHLSAGSRTRLARELAFEWPTSMFARLTQAVMDAVNAKVVHVQDVKDIQSDERFWYVIGLLQFLYAANALPCGMRRVDEHSSRGPKLEYENFILEGINKCEPVSEWHRWQKHPNAQMPEVLAVARFRLTPDFCSFLTHNNFVPVSFRRVCLLCDVWEQVQLRMGRVVPLQIQVRREPLALLEDVLRAFEGLDSGELRRPLRATFIGEEAMGHGATKEFFQVAIRSFLDGSEEVGLFKFNEHQRTYWFNEGADRRDAFHACGVLLGQAVLTNVLVPGIFPRVLYERLLQDLESPYAKPVSLEDIAPVSEDVAKSLQKVLDYADEDIGTVFGDLEWPEDVGRELTQQTKAAFVQAYADWYLHGRIAKQYEPLSEGFRSILGGSAMLRSMVDAVQLEKIVCGGAVPVDVAAIRRGVTLEGWSQEDEAEYLPTFWEVLEELNETERVHFVVFVSASDRAPLRGWQDFALIVQKNGVGDERLPTAYTCFCQLLLPRYASTDVMRRNLRSAIANSEGFGLR